MGRASRSLSFWWTLSCAALASLGLGASARAGELPCPPADEGTITLDGLGDDWADAQALQAGDDNAGITLRCDTQGKQLILEIEGRDQRIVRTKQARAGEDHVELTIGGKRYQLFPAAGGNPAKIVPGGARLASTSNEHGFVIEVAWPRTAFKQKERIPFSATFDDCDAAATLKTERSASVSGELAFTGGPTALESFLEERGLSHSLVRWQQPIRAGKDHVDLVLAGKLVAVVGEGYGYIELPVRDGTDVRNPRLVDFAGDGREAVLLEYVERGERGERTILAAYRPNGNGLDRIFAAELGKRAGSGALTTRYSLHRRGHANDLVLEALPAQGLDATSFHEAPAEDVLPILLPWSTEKKATYTFSGDGYAKK